MTVETKRPSKTIRGPRSKSASHQNVDTASAWRSLSDQVAQRIADDYVVGGRTPPGELLPSEGELCGIYEVSRGTIRAAIRTLWDHGLISVRNGVGAIVLPRAAEVRHGLDRLGSIDTFARETGHNVETGHMRWENVQADAAISRKLQIPVGAPVLQVKRSKIIDGAPSAWIIDTAPLDAVDEQMLRKKFDGSILDVLLSDGQYRIDYADSEVKPCLASGEVKEILSGNEDGLLLFLDTVTVTVEGKPILWGQVWLDPAHFTFAFHRRRFR
nr:GntR family transcriptional regulator [Aminobacter aminovorans]